MTDFNKLLNRKVIKTTIIRKDYSPLQVQNKMESLK